MRHRNSVAQNSVMYACYWQD